MQTFSPLMSIHAGSRQISFSAYSCYLARCRPLWLLLLIISYTAEANEWVQGPDGVSNQIEQEDKKRLETPGSEKLMAYAYWKESIKADYGLSFGVQYLTLYQQMNRNANNTERKSAGDIFRINGSYEVFESADGNAGWLEWRIENRHNLFGLKSPMQVGENAGIAALNPGEGYLNAFHTDLAVLNWTQVFADRVGFAVGRLSYASYLDAGYFQSFSSGFLNSAFIASPAVAFTGVGALGISIKGFLTPHIITGIQAHDANAKPGEFSLDTIRQNEYLSAVELGWTPDPYQLDISLVQLTLWHKDALNQTGAKEGYGLAFNAVLVTGDFIPFLHMAFNNSGGGVNARSAISTGLEYSAGEGIWSLGFGWADPVNPLQTGEEYMAESSYRFDLLAGLEMMLDLQYIRYTPKSIQQENSWVASLRINLNL